MYGPEFQSNFAFGEAKITKGSFGKKCDFAYKKGGFRWQNSNRIFSHKFGEKIVKIFSFLYNFVIFDQISKMLGFWVRSVPFWVHSVPVNMWVSPVGIDNFLFTCQLLGAKTVLSAFFQPVTKEHKRFLVSYTFVSWVSGMYLHICALSHVSSRIM